MNKLSNKNLIKIILIVLTVAFLATMVYFLDYFNLLPKSSYNADDFHIETVKSMVDFNTSVSYLAKVRLITMHKI